MKLLLLLMLVVSLFGCDNPEINIKPKGVPDTAFWVGGSDGGVYINIKQNKKIKNKFYTEIYFDSTGEIWYEGWLYYSGDKSLNIKDKSIYSFWDGDILYLVNNETLVKNPK